MKKIVTHSFLLVLVTLVLAACSGGGGETPGRGGETPKDKDRDSGAVEFNLGIREGSDTAQQFAGLDGQETEETKITVSGNVNDFEPATETLSVQNTSISIQQLQAIVNGSIYVLDFDASGDFEQELPVSRESNTIQLRVVDIYGDSYTTEPVTVIVTLDRLDLQIVLTWDRGEKTDIDLHLFKVPDSEQVNPNFYTWRDNGYPHVFWDAHKPTSFGTTPAQNPFLDIDDRDGYGPETIVLQEMVDGNYHIWVHTYDLPRGVSNTNAVVEIYFNGEVYEFKRNLAQHWSTWEIAIISAPSATVEEIDKLY